MTTPDGVWTASAWVIFPLLWTVIVTLPALATAGAFGVILNSVSDSVSAPAGEPALRVDLVADVVDVVVEVVVDPLADAPAELEEPDEPHPASRPATITGASETNLGMH